MKRKGRLLYLPIEPYDSRYTEYLSVAGGVFETQCLLQGVTPLPVRPILDTGEIKTVSTGSVLDPLERCRWGFEQTEKLVQMLVRRELNPEQDVIYIEDFWHPGLEMIPYTQHLVYGNDVSKHVPVYSFSHAQTPDPYDFTHPMREWMRPMERGWLKYQAGVFCAAHEMLMQFKNAQFSVKNMHATGQVFHAETIQRIVQTSQLAPCKREPRVVWSSRWDKEKNPDFFLSLMHNVIARRNDVSFDICTSAPELKSNWPECLHTLRCMAYVFPNRIRIWNGITKGKYFEILQKSKVQFNCASQDFVSYTLTESTLNGCAPLYPRYLTFPDALAHRDKNLYGFKDLDEAESKLYALIDEPVEDYSWVWKPYESSVHRMLYHMGFDVPKPSKLSQLHKQNRQNYGDWK